MCARQFSTTAQERVWISPHSYFKAALFHCRTDSCNPDVRERTREHTHERTPTQARYMVMFVISKCIYYNLYVIKQTENYSWRCGWFCRDLIGCRVGLSDLNLLFVGWLKFVVLGSG